jgi:adenine/guanine phosphoribosyltransferase-like PRPP-binding protein
MSYLPLNHTARKNQILHAVHNLKNFGIKFDAIACTGLSGSLVAPAVAAELDKPIVIVRKGESSHGNTIESSKNFKDAFNYIIIDDLVESGRTMTRIKKVLTKECGAKCVGIYFYNQDSSEGRVVNYQKRFPKLWMYATSADYEDEAWSSSGS